MYQPQNLNMRSGSVTIYSPTLSAMTCLILESRNTVKQGNMIRIHFCSIKHAVTNRFYIFVSTSTILSFDDYNIKISLFLKTIKKNYFNLR